jgi:crossover junction endodeoxyribonuclease RuvC
VIILAIDPGIARTGFAIVRSEGHKLTAIEYGCIETSPDLPTEKRLVEIRRDLTSVISTHKPHVAALERLVFVHNQTSAVAVGQARGVILMTLSEHDIVVREYAPTEVKQAVTRSGRADKLQVGSAVKLIYSLPSIPQPDDAADALALAACHASRVE